MSNISAAKCKTTAYGGRYESYFKSIIDGFFFYFRKATINLESLESGYNRSISYMYASNKSNTVLPYRDLLVDHLISNLGLLFRSTNMCSSQEC